MNGIQVELRPILDEFLRNEASFYAHTRLNFISEQMNRLKPEIALLNPMVGNRKMQPLEDRMDRLSLESKSLNIQYKLDRMDDLATKALDLETDGSNAINEMGLVMVKVQETIKDVLDISEALGSGITPDLLRTSIKASEDLLESMMGIDFLPTRSKTVEELDMARTLMNNVTVWSAPVDLFQKSVMGTIERLDMLEEKIFDMDTQTKTAAQHIREANEINFRNKEPQASKKIEMINNIEEEIREKQTLGDDLVSQSEGFTETARESYDDVRSKNDDIKTKIDDFDKRIATYSEETDVLFDLKRQAAEKAEELTNNANELERVAQQSQSPAEAAIHAATAYENILAAVETSEIAANDALKDAKAAAEMSDGVQLKAKNSMIRIEETSYGANGASNLPYIVRDELSPKLISSKAGIEYLTGRNKETKQNLEETNNKLEKLDDLRNNITETKKYSEDSLKDGIDVLASIKARANQISSKKKIADVVRDSNSELELAKTNVKKTLNEYESKSERSKREANQENNISNRLQKLQDRKAIIEATGNINADLLKSIKEKVGQARKLLGTITKPSVSFKRGSTLEVKNPDNLESLATKTDISFYVSGVGVAANDTMSTDGKKDTRAFLFYLGNLEGTRQKVSQVLTDDYMAIQVGTEGSVSLTMDLGSGPLTLTSTQPLKSTEWSQVEVNRVGRNVDLVVRTEAGRGEITEDVVSGTFPLLNKEGKPFLSGSVFNLHPDLSRIFVGGFPTEDTPVQEAVRATDMTGKIEGLKIGGKEVGLWNYKAATLIEGANTRNKFLPTENNEMRFEGDGYVRLDPVEYYLEMTEKNMVQFKFKAEALNGLMFLAGSVENGFIALKLDGGKVVFSYKIGSDGDLVNVESYVVDLGVFYIVRAERDGRGGYLYLNGQLVGQGASQQYNLALVSVTDLLFGGYPGTDYQTTGYNFQDTGFTGCIHSASIAKDQINMSPESNVTNVNMYPSCEKEVQNTLSFNPGSPGYVQLDSQEVNGSITVSFMFKTSAPQGLLFYMKDRDVNEFGDHFSYLSLSMLDGALYLYAFPDIRIVTKDPQTQQFVTFNDNNWHLASITVIEEPRKTIFLQIDDFFEANSGQKENLPPLRGTEYETYFGGISEDLRLRLQPDVTKNDGPFIGCIKDAIVMEEYVDFQESPSITGARLGECGTGGQVIDRVPTTTETSVTTDDPEETSEPEYNIIDLFPDANYGSEPQTEGRCGLPSSPALDPDLNIESGFRFGVKTGSYVEYQKKNLQEMVGEKSRFKIDFKTTHTDGLIFFMAGETGKKDFMALYLKNGKLVYSFDLGSGKSNLATEDPVNDGKWHTAEFSRVKSNGKLVLDSIEVKVEEYNRRSGGATTSLEVKPNIWLGGLNETYRSDENIRMSIMNGARGDVPGYVGCLRNLKYEVTKNGKRRMRGLGTKWTKNNLVIPCSDKVESGFFFGPKGGRIRAQRKFRVGLDFDITMKIKPRNMTGILVAVRGRRDYLILHMKDGYIEFQVDNGRGAIVAKYEPKNDKYEFCNGEWHEIHAVKAKNVVTLAVDKVFAQPGIGVPGVSSTDTNNPIFLGGHPRPGKFKLSRDEVSYSGCMKDVVIESNPVEITPDMIVGDIHSHVCPTI